MTPRPADRVWEVGSDFDADSVWHRAKSDLRPVRGASEGARLLASGRQALTLVARGGRAVGCDTVLFPGHFCESMLTPFRRLGMRVVLAPVTEDWRLRPAEEPLEPSRTLVYSMSYFGVPESEEWLSHVADLRTSGARVLADETHRVFGPSPSDVDWTIASLRKMLPVPDGARLTGEIADEVSEARTTPVGQGTARWRAMQAKTAQLPSGERSFLELFRAAEHLTEQDEEPAPACEVTRQVLDLLDVVSMREARRANASALEKALEGARARITTVDAAVPSHHVLATQDAEALRRHLVRHRVYAPVHWPRPDEWNGEWREDILSIPVDHRYTPRDMERVAELIHEYEREGV